MNIFDVIAGRKPTMQQGWVARIPQPGGPSPVPTPAPAPAPGPSTPAPMQGAGTMAPASSRMPTSGWADIIHGDEMTPGLPESYGNWAQAQIGEDAAKARSFLNSAEIRGPNLWERIGSSLSDPMMRGALLRSGAATINGGIGAGIQAGANWYDQTQQRKASEATAAAQWADQMRLKELGIGLDAEEVKIRQQQADTDTLYKAAQMENMALQSGIDLAELNETIRKNKAGEQLTQREQAITVWAKQQGFSLEAASINQRDVDSQRDFTLGNRKIDADLYQHKTPSGSTVYTQEQMNERYYNPVFTGGDGTTTETTVGSDGKKTVKTTQTKRPPVMRTQEDYDALPSGTGYYDSTGLYAVKP